MYRPWKITSGLQKPNLLEQSTSLYTMINVLPEPRKIKVPVFAIPKEGNIEDIYAESCSAESKQCLSFSQCR